MIVLYFFLLSLFRQDAPVEPRPNILWISVEDMSPRLAAYGDQTISTPNIDRLAAEGVVFEQVFTTAGVCSPARNAIITGRYQTSNGGHNMRTLYNTYPEKTGLPKSYNAVPPAGVKCFPEYLRNIGYYTTNNVKTDYQFEAPPTVWDEVSDKADWRGRAKEQPFFAVINFTTTHESQIWARAKNPMRVDPKKVPLPPYYPDNEISRTDVARQYSNISEMDDQVGEVLKKLEEDGLLENTIIFFWSDHGDGLPFYKREVFRRGLHVPLIIRYPNKAGAGTRDSRMISAIDFGPTVMSLAGIPTPKNMHGQAFLGPHQSKNDRQYIFGARDRLDSEYDRVRSVMDGRFQYIRNFYPERPRYMDVEYRKSMPTMAMLLEMNTKGELNAEQSFWFQQKKPAEELYDFLQDPYQLHNLASDPAYAKDLKRLRKQMDIWLKTTVDLGAVPEKELVKTMWNGGTEPPKTEKPSIVKNKNGMLEISCPTAGASIAYRPVGSEKWQNYTGAFSTSTTIETRAMRIGYEPSEIVKSEL